MARVDWESLKADYIDNYLPKGVSVTAFAKEKGLNKHNGSPKWDGDGSFKQSERAKRGIPTKAKKRIETVS